MDTHKLINQITFASGPELEKIRARMEVEQVRRDEERAERERKQAKWQKWQIGAAAATIAAVIASAIVIYQGFENLRQQQEAAVQQQAVAVTQDQGARYSSISQLLLDVDKTIADHPRLISCFWDVNCNAEPKLTTKEIDQARALSVYIVDYYQYVYAQIMNLHVPSVPSTGEFVLRKDEPPENNDDWVTWSETIVGGFRNSAMLCDALQQSAGAYGDTFVHAVAVTAVCPRLKDPYQSPRGY